jgi:uncharacterized protein YbjT (DUF2867 family)
MSLDDTMNAHKTALVAGATGLVGSHLLTLLLADEDYDKVVVLARKPIPLDHPRLMCHKVDFDNLMSFAQLPDVNDVYCCLGTTIGKAGSRQAFKRVDYEYPFSLAHLALGRGAARYLIVTAVGADPQSRIFYNRTKGETERSISDLPFRSIHIFRPSILVGERSEFRRGEKAGITMMKFLSPAMIGGWRKYRPIEAECVARGMTVAARMNHSGVMVYESDEIKGLCGN